MKILRYSLVAALLAAAACRSDGRTVLTVYSPHGKDLLDYFETEFEKANPTIDVQWVDMGSQEVLERIRAEAANPQADVWFGAPAEAFDRATRENLLEPYAPSWAKQVDAEAREAGDNWYGTYLTPEVIGYNSVAVSDAEAPRDWDDVLDPKWKGKILIRDPIASGTMRAIFGAIMARSMTQTGKPDAGYEWLRKLDANTREYVLNPTLLYQKLGRQEGVVTLWDMPDIATLQQSLGIPVKYVIPSSGTPLLVDGIAIVRGTERRKEAELYYEFVTTPEALVVSAEEFLRIPARKDIPQAGLPAWIREALATIKPMPVDRALMAAHLDEWMKYWDANIRNRGNKR
ncbi:MAG TPA: extracellular solute-binding protein [Gemmatimonadaceae bacterium]|nr:extracellular solute-binding protein [Gemmatimonadaceae bacterium]